MAGGRAGRTVPRSCPSKKAFAESILKDYRPSDGCPPLRTHWGGHDLAATEWLKTFADQIADDESRRNAWNKLKDKCDTSYIIELLYLFTLADDPKARASKTRAKRDPKTTVKKSPKTRVENDQNAYNLLTKLLTQKLARYDKLCDEIRSLMENPRIQHPMLYLRADFTNQLQMLQTAKQHLQDLRDREAKWGSKKRNPRDWYLFLLGVTTKEATGFLHGSELATLIETAYAAHGKEDKVDVSQEAVEKQIRRWTKFMNAEVFDGRVYFPLGGDRSQPRLPRTRASGDEDIPF